MIEPVDDALEERRIGNAADVTPGKERKPVEEKAEEENHRSTTKDLSADVSFVGAAGASRAQRQMRRDSNDEQEEGKHQIRRRPPIPRGMFERRIDRAPCPWIVDEEHPGNRDPTKNI